MYRPLEKLFVFVKTLIVYCRKIAFSIYYPLIRENFYTKQAVSFKNDVFADIGVVEASDKKDGRVKILELGCGPGYNLDVFPKTCRLIAVDKNKHFKKVFLNNLKNFPGIHLDGWFSAAAESLHFIPTNSVDIVVTSLLHCSVDSNKQVLNEIKRVLVPGGRYYFYEHVLDEPDTIRYKVQKLMSYTGIWKFFGDGCTFRSFEKEITKTGFAQCSGKRYVFKNDFSISYFAQYLVASHFGGFAVKE